MGGQNSGGSLYLLAELVILHNRVEKELETVETAVMDLLHHQRTETSSSVKAGRLLGGARNRILDALAQQRSLLWEFSEKSRPMPAQPNSRGGTRLRTNRQRNRAAPAIWSFDHHKQAEQHSGIYDRWGDATMPCRHQSDSDSESDRCEQARSGDLEWKRDTLMRMQNLLRRKAEGGTASEGDTAMIRRDMAKIDAALGGLTHLQQREAIHRCTTGVPGERRAPEPAQSVGRASQITAEMVTGEDVSATDNAERVMEVDDGSSSSRVRQTSWREARAREHGAMPAARSAMSRCHSGGDDVRRSLGAAESGCGGQPVRQEELRLPDGLEFLLERISEGVRPSRRGATQREGDDDSSTGSNDRDNAKYNGNGKKFTRELGISPTTSLRPTGVGLCPQPVSGGIPEERERGPNTIAQLRAVLCQSDREIDTSDGSEEGSLREASRGMTDVGKWPVNENLVAGGFPFREGGEGMPSTRAAKKIETAKCTVHQGGSRRRDPNSAVASGIGVWGITGNAGDKALKASTDAVAEANVRPVSDLAPQTPFRRKTGVALKMRLAGADLCGGSDEKENYLR